MKRLPLIVLLAFAALFLASCEQKNDYKVFVGTWGVEKIEYYNIDYAGNPIPSTIQTYIYDPDDIGNGIQLVFRDDMTGEMRDNDVDTVWNDAHDSYVVNPDTTLVKRFDYSYDSRKATIYMNMEYVTTFKLEISNLTSNSFTYENEWWKDYVERAHLKRLSDTPTSKSATRQGQGRKRPFMPGSFLGER